MSFHKLIAERESIRTFSNKKISDKVLRRILEAGRLAPSAANKQPWSFLLVSSDEMKAKIHKAYRGEWLREAPHILIVVGRQSEAWTRRDGYNSLETDLTIAMTHMILAAESESIATCYLAAFDEKILREALNLSDDEKVFAITPLGYTPEGFVKQGEKKRKAFDEVVRYL